MAQVQHVKSQLSAAGEYVPTPREWERILRDVGCSRSVAKTLMSKMFDAEAVCDAEPTPRDAQGEPTDSDLEQAANAVAEKFLAASVRLPTFMRG